MTMRQKVETIDRFEFTHMFGQRVRWYPRQDVPPSNPTLDENDVWHVDNTCERNLYKRWLFGLTACECLGADAEALAQLIRVHGREVDADLVLMGSAVPFAAARCGGALCVAPYGEPRAVLVEYDATLLYERLQVSIERVLFWKDAFGHVPYSVSALHQADTGCQIGIKNVLEEAGAPLQGFLRDIPDSLMQNRLDELHKYLRRVYNLVE